MDLHLTADQATDTEKSAVDHELGGPQSGWRAAARDINPMGTARFAPRRPAICSCPSCTPFNARIGWISRGAINYVALRMNVASRRNLWRGFVLRHVLTRAATSRRCPRVRRHRLPHSWRSKTSARQLEKKSGPAGSPDSSGRATWLRSPCLGLCERAPAALLSSAGRNRRANESSLPPRRMPFSPACK